MKEKIEKYLDFTYNSKLIHILLILIVTLALSLHMKDFQIYDTHDGPFHLLRILATNEAMEDGIFPPLISPYGWNEVGTGMNIFYPPITTYIPVLFMQLFNFSAGLALKSLAVISIFLSGLFMYFCIIEFTNDKKIAIISAIIYMIIPYKLSNIYVRVAAGEFVVSCFIPLVFMGLHSLIEGNQKKHYLISIGAVGIILSHTISTMYVAMFSAIYILVHLKKVLNWPVIKKIIINCLFIIFIGGIFIFPYLETSIKGDYRINNDEMIGTYNEYLNDNTVGLESIFTNKPFEIYNNVLYLGLPAIIGFALTIINLPFLIKKKEINRDYVLFIIFSLLCIWMSIRIFPWLKVPKIFAKLQFPWRMLGYCCFFISYISAINYANILKKVPRFYFIKDVTIVVLISISIINSIEISKNLKTWNVFVDKDVEKAWYNERWFPITSFDFAPVKADYQAIVDSEYIDFNITSNNENLTIKNEKKELLSYSAKIEGLQKGNTISVQYLYYPYYMMKIMDDGKTISKIRPNESDKGWIEFDIDKDIEQKVDIEIYYKPTATVYISYILGFVSTLCLIVYIIWFNSKNKEKELVIQ